MLLTQTHELEAPRALRLSDVDCPLHLRRSRRATRFSLKVSYTERMAILTLPYHVHIEEARVFLSRHKDWLKRQVDRLPKPVPFTHGSIVPLRGQPHKIDFVGQTRHKGVIWVEAAQAAQGFSIAQPFAVSATPCNKYAATAVTFTNDTRDLPRICVSGETRHGPRRLADWLRNEAKADLIKRVEHHGAALGCTPKRISVRDQSTRWGSCSTSGTICFSWRLIFAPTFVLDYVAAHEVAHLREMNHSQRFWRLVRETMPDMQRARSWLKQNGAELHRFGATL
jgi:predicted metal-dependent hydrolase